MTEACGWKFPEGEQHLPLWMNRVRDKHRSSKTGELRLLYQGAKYRRAMSLVRSPRRGAIDIGGHIGLWSYMMAHDFEHVWAFEPMPEHRACYEHNMRGLKNWTLFPVALGQSPGTCHVRTRTVGSSGDTGVDLSGNGLEVTMQTLDQFRLNDIDFLKVDCEGFELFVLRGGEDTLRRNKPVVIVEQKPETGMEKNYQIGTKDAVRFLESLGYREAFEMAGDHIMRCAP